MNPLVLVAALAAVSPPGLHADAAGRTITYQLRVVHATGEPLTEAQVLAEADRPGGSLGARLTAVEGRTANVFRGHTRTFTTGVEAVEKDGRAAVVPTTKDVELGTRVEVTGRAVGGAVAVRVKVTETRLGEARPGVTLNVTELGADGLQRLGVVMIEAPRVDAATVEAAVEVPAGRPLVLTGPVRTDEVRSEVGVPVLSRIPYVSRLFTTTGIGRVPVRTYLVLTATVADGERPVAPAPRAVAR